MDDIAILKSLIRDDSRIKPIPEHGKHIAILKEDNVEDSAITIRNIPPDTIIIKADNFKEPKSLFNGGKGECKRADFIIINQTKRVAIFIEMKRKKGHIETIKKQLKGAMCLFSYCREIGKTFWHSNDFLQDYKTRFVIVEHTNIVKRQTKGHKTVTPHDSPEEPLIIAGPHYLQFNMLAS